MLSNYQIYNFYNINLYLGRHTEENEVQRNI